MTSLSELRLRSGKQCDAAVRGPIAAVVEPSRNGGKRRQVDERDAGDADLMRLAHRRCEIEVGDRECVAEQICPRTELRLQYAQGGDKLPQPGTDCGAVGRRLPQLSANIVSKCYSPLTASAHAGWRRRFRRWMTPD
jgi:hypothetical protein